MSFRPPPRKPAPGAFTAATFSKWHAVSVVPGEPNCTAVQQLRGMRFLAAEAPRIPVPQCAMPARCQCVYRHYADRRAALRRIADRGMHGRMVALDRRKQEDRRRTES
jgi:hypothetical protein